MRFNLHSLSTRTLLLLICYVTQNHAHFLKRWGATDINSGDIIKKPGWKKVKERFKLLRSKKEFPVIQENISESIKRSQRSLLCLLLSVGVYTHSISTLSHNKKSLFGSCMLASVCLSVCACGCMWLTPRGYKYSYTKQGWKEAGVWYFLILTSALPRWNCFWCAFEALPSSKSLVHEVSVVFYLISLPTWRRAEEREVAFAPSCFVKLDCLSPLL